MPVPATRIPCLFARRPAGRDFEVICAAVRDGVDEPERRVVSVLRSLLGPAIEEVAFRVDGSNCGKSVLVVDFDDDGNEHVERLDCGVGVDGVEALLSFGSGDVCWEEDVNLQIHVEERQVSMRYSAGHIPRDFAGRLLDTFCEQEIDGQLSILNHPPTTFFAKDSPDALLHAPFLKQASENPDATALEFRTENGQIQFLTYGELSALSLSLSRAIREAIAKPGIIPMLLSPSLELYVAYLGILRAGCAFSPLPDLENTPVRRVQELIRTVGGKIVLGVGGRPDWLDEDVKWLDVSAERQPCAEDEVTWDSPKGSDLAYVLFTSGSTGKPKGVEISHHAVSTAIAGHMSVRALPKGARWYQFAASTFDPSIMEIFMSLSSGTTLLSSHRSTFLSNPESVLTSLNATHMMCTPSFASLLDPKEMPQAFELWCMGEKLGDKVVRNFNRDGKALYNAYGPTEAAINVTLRRHPADEDGARLGKPIPSAGMVVLGKDGSVLPMGWVGELGLVGDHLTRGYHDAPDLTAQTFIEDVPGVGRTYKTGDLARCVTDREGRWTEIEYLGRIDGAARGQVKLAGRRVELGEIDTILSLTEGIRSVHSVVLSSASGGSDKLLALVVPLPDGSEAEIRQALAATAENKLPTHMRPLAYYFASDAPRTASGKADRRAIVELVKELDKAASASSSDSEQLSMESEVLAQIMNVLARTLDVDEGKIGAGESLLRMGIDSLRGVRFLTLARESGIEGLGIQDVLRAETPIALAKLVEERRAVGEKGNMDDDGRHFRVRETIRTFEAQARAAVQKALPSLHDAAEATILPATPMQTSVLALFLRTADPAESTGGEAYVNHSVYTLASDVDVPRFKSAWEAVVGRKENAIMRAKFVLVDESRLSTFAVVVPQGEGEVEWVEVDGDVETYLAECKRRIGLTRPCEVALVRSGEGVSVRFVLTMMHALFDGASLALMLEELASVYHGTGGKIPRREFVHSVEDALAVDSEVALVYWLKKLEGFTSESFPDLTGLRTHAKSLSHHVSTVISALSFSDVQEEAKAMGTTVLALCQAAWASVLLTYSESDSPDVVFGSIVGGRNSQALQETVGPVFTAVPIRLRDADTDTSTRDVLSRLVEDNIGSLAHRYPPLSVLSRKEGGGGIIYDTTLALQSFARGASQTDLWTLAEYPPMVTEFAVVLEIWPEADDSIRLRATCANSVLTPLASEAMLSQFDDLLSSLVQRPDIPFKDHISHIRPSLQSAINTSPQLASLPPGHFLIHHQLEENAATCPDAVALWFKHDLDRPELDTKWSYGELDRRANRLARLLVELYGDLSDVAVPICMEKCPELYVGILGIVKAGGAWCPIDVAAPDARKTDLLTRAGGPVVLFRNDEQLALNLPLISGHLDGLTLDDVRLASQSDEAPVIATQAHHLAYLIWTSGTTGAPKGVPIEHRAALQSLTELQKVIPYRSDDVRCLNFSSYTFDVSVLDIFYALGKPRGTLCSSTKDNLVANFVPLVNAFQATHTFLTPAFMAQGHLCDCPSIQSLISIGEKLPDSVADAWSKPRVVSLNTYGPAESTIIATYRRFSPRERMKAHNVGHPIQTVSCFALKEGRILPRGAVGELALGGRQNARGYHHQAEMTAKKFINHPVAGSVYLTGDIVRFLADGSCEFVGRNDDLVKLGGIRVELSEISTALSRAHSLARDVVTMLLSRHDRPQKVVCTFIAAPSLASDDNVCTDAKAVEIARATADKARMSLPLYMHPSVFVVLKRLPHTASNKIDRNVLHSYYSSMDIASWEKSIANGSRAEDDMWTETEMTLRSALAELSGVSIDQISRITQISAIGIDSIRALQFASRLRSVGIDLAVNDILSSPTIKQLAAMVDDPSAVMPSSYVPRWLENFDKRWIDAVRTDVPDAIRVLPCTPLQEGMLGESSKAPDAYWQHRLFYLDKIVNLGRLEASWVAIATTTEALRMTFLPSAAYSSRISTDSYVPVFIQVLRESCGINIKTTKCSRSEMSSRFDESARDVVTSWTGSKTSPWAVNLSVLDDNSLAMMISIHHALYDGDAFNYLLDDVQASYMAIGVPPRLQFTDALVSSALTVNPKKSEPFWSDMLKSFGDSEAPTWPDLSDTLSSKTERTFFTSSFDMEQSRISQLCEKAGSSLIPVIQSSWAILLSSYLATSKVVFGETLSLRTRDIRLQNAIAPLITTCPIVASVHSHSTVRDVVNEVSRCRALNMDCPMVSPTFVRRLLKRPVNQPVYPAIFVVYYDDEPNTPKQHELFSEMVSHERKALQVEHHIAINIFVSQENVAVTVAGSSERMSPKQVDLLSEQFNVILFNIVQGLDKPVSSIGKGIEPQLLSYIGQKRTIPSKHSCLPIEKLRSQALTTPSLIAVQTVMVVGGEIKITDLSYAELEEASNRVAHWIRDTYSSVDVVGFAMPRSASSLSYLLGVLKSGKTYLPIGENIPSFRKRFMLKAAKAGVVLTITDMALDFRQCKTLDVVAIDNPAHISSLSNHSRDAVEYDEPEIISVSFADDISGSSRGISTSLTNLNSTLHSLRSFLKEQNLICENGRFLSWIPLSYSAHLIDSLLPFCIGSTIVNVPHLILQEVLISVINTTSTSFAILPPAWIERERITPRDVPSVKCLLASSPFSDQSSVKAEWLHSPYVTTLIASGTSDFSTMNTIGLYRERPVAETLFNFCHAMIFCPSSSNLTLRGHVGELYLSGDFVASPTLQTSFSTIVETEEFGWVVKTGLLARIRANDAIQFEGPSEAVPCLEDKTFDLERVSASVLSHSDGKINVYTLAISPHGSSTLQPSIVSFFSLCTRWDPYTGILPTLSDRDIPFAKAVHSACRSHAPPYLVPDYIVPLDFIPVKSAVSWSVDTSRLRKAFSISNLQALQSAAITSAVPRVARDLSPLESKVREVLSEVSGTSEDMIGAETTTLEVGIDSLLAISLSLKLKSLGFDVLPHLILGGPSVETMACSLNFTPVNGQAQFREHRLDDAFLNSIDDSFGDAVEHVMPCLPLQEGLVARTLNSEVPIYVNHFVFQLHELDIVRLRAAIDDTVISNGIFRTCFVPNESSIVQVVFKESDYWQLRCISGDALEAIESMKEDIEQNVVESITTRPPFRVSLVEGKAASAYICFTMHHALYDGESLSMFLSEVSQRYDECFTIKRPPVKQLVEYLSSSCLDTAQAFFAKYLHLAPHVSIPVNEGKDTHHESFALDIPLSSLEHISRSMQASLHVLALTAFGVALAEMRQSNDIIFGIVLSGRTVLIERIETIMAPCIATLPVRIRTTTPESLSRIVDRSRADYASLLEHQHTPLRQIQRWAGSGEALFDSIFQFNRAPPSGLQDRIWTPIEGVAKLDHALAVSVNADAITNVVTLRAGHSIATASVFAIQGLLRRMADLIQNPALIVDIQPKQLSAAAAAAPPAQTYDASLWSPDECTIRDLVAEVCKVDLRMITKDISFLHLGLDSISSIHLAQRLRSAGIPLPTNAIMQYPCVGALANYVHSNTTTNGDINKKEVDDVTRDLFKAFSGCIPTLSNEDKITFVFPTTPLQTGMLTKSLSSGGQYYTVPLSLTLKNEVSVDRLKSAWRRVIDSSDILRCTFHVCPSGDSPWIGAIHSESPLQWTEHRVMSAKIKAGELIDNGRFVDEKSFEKPPIHFHLICDHNIRVLLIIIHHSLYDGLSLGYILDDVFASYCEINMPARPQFTQAVPYIHHSSKNKGFWERHLSGYAPSCLPRLHESNSNGSPTRCSLVVPLSNSILSEIRSLGVTVQSMTLLAWGKAMCSISSSLDVVFGHVVSGRGLDLEDALHAYGPLFNTVPFRVNLSDKSMTNAHAAHIQHMLNLESEPFHHVALRDIQNSWRGSSAKLGPLFECLFVFQHSGEARAERSKLWKPFDVGRESMVEYPLCIEITRRPSSLELRASSLSAIFDDRELQDVLHVMKQAFEDAALNPMRNALEFPTNLRDAYETSTQTMTPEPNADIDHFKRSDNITPTEDLLQSICSSVTHMSADKLGVNVPLYAFGLDSVAAIQIVAKARADGIDLSVADVFDGETIAGISTIYDDRDRGKKSLLPSRSPVLAMVERQKALRIAGVTEVVVEDVLPILPGQSYHLCSWLSCKGSYYQPVFVYKAVRAVNPVRLRDAWMTLCSRHSILRTSFTSTSPSSAVQIIFKNVERESWSFIDADDDFEEVVKSAVQAEYRTASDLYIPPSRAKLVRVKDDYALLLSLHHATYDAWSVPLLLADLCAIYEGRDCQSASNFSAYIKSDPFKSSDESAMFWRSTITGNPSSSLLRPRKFEPTNRQFLVRAPGVVTSLDTLQQHCQKAGVSLQSLVLAVWGRVAKVLTQQDSSIIGIFHSGRSANFEAIDKLAAPLLNVLPMSVPAASSGRIAEVARQLQKDMGLRTNFEQCDLRDISKWIGHDDKGPLFNIFLNLMWHGDVTKTQPKDSLFRVLSVGTPVDFAPCEGLELQSSIDQLNHEHIPKHAIFIDVVLNSETKSIGLAIRCHEALMGAGDVRGVVQDFQLGVENAMAEL